MASWIPVTVVPTSLPTVAMETFMTELSRVMRNCADARVRRTSPLPAGGASRSVTTGIVAHRPDETRPCGVLQHAVGMRGFEPRTSCSQRRRAAKRRYIPLSEVDEARVDSSGLTRPFGDGTCPLRYGACTIDSVDQRLSKQLGPLAGREPDGKTGACRAWPTGR